MTKTIITTLSLVIALALFFGASANTLGATFVDLPTTFVSAFLTNPDGTAMVRSDFLKQIGNDIALFSIVGVPAFVVHLKDGYIAKDEANTTIEKIIYFIEEILHD